MKPPPMCWQCKHFKGDTPKKGMHCDAFPKGIPSDIANGSKYHLRKRKDQDNDFVFELGDLELTLEEKKSYAEENYPLMDWKFFKENNIDV